MVFGVQEGREKERERERERYLCQDEDYRYFGLFMCLNLCCCSVVQVFYIHWSFKVHEGDKSVVLPLNIVCWVLILPPCDT